MNAPPFGLILWTVYILAVAAGAKYLLGYSHLKFIKELLAELTQLIHGQLSASSINALGMILTFLVCVTYLFSGSFQRLISLAEQSAEANTNGAEVWPLLGILIIFAMFCVIMCSKSRE